VRHIALGALCFLACGCGSNDQETSYQALSYPVPMGSGTPTDAPSSIAAPTVPVRPPHNYDAKEGALYSYIAAISEDERKAGKGAGDVLTYAYLGKQNGKHTLVRVTADGRPIETAYCGTPCRVITLQDGRQYGFTEGSVIGAAFADAIAGRLEASEYRSEGSVSRIVPVSRPKSAPSRGAAETEAGELLLWLDANDKCLWSTDRDERDRACSTRDNVLGPSLRSAGYCFGKQNQSPTDWNLHRCEGGSLPLPTLRDGG
jgi:hypothetical protein